MTHETHVRFLSSIAKQLPAERVAEVHLFAPIRQGGVESGVAVIAVERLHPVTIDVDGGYVPPSDVADATPIESQEAVIVHDQLADESAFVADETVVGDEIASSAAGSTSPQAPSRFTVYSATYRHTLKGPERGKWEVSITEEADAPLITVDAVVRGVHRRSGDVDDAHHLSGDEFRAALPTAVA